MPSIVTLGMFLFGLLFSTAASSSFVYDEAISGDLSDTAPFESFDFAVDEFTLVDTSYVYGKVYEGTVWYGSSESEYTSDLDGFNLAIGPDTRLDLIQVFSEYSYADPNGGTMDFSLSITDLATSQTVFDQSMSFPESFLNNFVAFNLSLGPGDYNVLFGQTGSAIESNYSYDMYLDAMYVEPVPLPAAAWLLLSGLMSLGLFVKRRA